MRSFKLFLLIGHSSTPVLLTIFWDQKLEELSEAACKERANEKQHRASWAQELVELLAQLDLPHDLSFSKTF